MLIRVTTFTSIRVEGGFGRTQFQMENPCGALLASLSNKTS